MADIRTKPMHSLRVAVCCSVLQCVAACCRVLQSATYGVAAIRRLLKMISLFCNRALEKRPIFCKRDVYFEGAYESKPAHRKEWLPCTPLSFIHFICRTSFICSGYCATRRQSSTPVMSPALLSSTPAMSRALLSSGTALLPSVEHSCQVLGTVPLAVSRALLYSTPTKCRALLSSGTVLDCFEVNIRARTASSFRVHGRHS